MVRLTKIYTRGGDAGETSLGDGSRIAKHSSRVAAYGTVDEANAALGLARVEIARAPTPEPQMDALLGRIQNDLFDLGADLCRPNPDKDGEAKYPVLRVTQAQVDRLEAEIDAMNADLAPLRSFVLPGGSALAAHLHLCRTVSRRRGVEFGPKGKAIERALSRKGP